MGEVYRARDTTLDREVALKILSPLLAGDAQYMSRFQREAQMLALLNHPHIAILFGLQETDGVRALVMELVEGPTLAERIALGALPLEEAIAIARQIADALETAHERGIVHRDLKPANVKLTRDGIVKVLDFGLAKALDDDTGVSSANSPTLTMTATRAGVILGTAAYMPPEQAKGKRVDRRADIWAFGVVLFEMLTGGRMYEEETIPETLASVMRDEPRWETLPADTPPTVRKLLRRCLDKDPKRRLRDIGEARIALDETGTDSAAVVPAPQVQLAPKSSARLPWALFVAALAALALASFHIREAPPPERVLRFSIAAPLKTTLQGFALSPDGRYLAMAAMIDGKTQLWLRALEASQPQSVPGTEDAQFPFWSPDCKYIGFFAQGKLKKIAVTGGPAQTLCDSAGARGGTWNRAGVIVFASSGGVLQRVQAAGGVPVLLNKESGAPLQRYPVFLPDGNRFLYLALAGPNTSGVHLGSLDALPGPRLLSDLSGTAYVPPQPGNKQGHVLFIRDDTLMAQPVEPNSLQPAGDVFPVAEQVSFGSIPGSPVSVSEGGILAYRAGGSGGDNQLVWYDRAGKELVKVGAPSISNGFALSADEKTLAVPRSENTSRSGSDIWLHEIARGVDSRFTVHLSRNFQPVWSPDGRRLLFTSNRAGAFGLYMKETTGSGQDELFLKGEHSRFSTDWSRDGRLVLYVDTDAKNKWDLWTASADGEHKPALFLQTEFNECQGQFSPDGKWVAYSSDESGRYEIYVRPFPPRPGKWKISIGGGEFPRWRRDGKELFFLSPERMLMSVTIKAVSGANPILEVSAPQALFQSHIAQVPAGFNNYNYVVAADGKRFLVNTAGKEAVDTPVTLVTNWLASVKR